MSHQSVGMSQLKRYGILYLTVFALLLSLTPSQCEAQVLYGSIVGNVRDQSGAAIPGAEVTATHVETSQSRSTISNDVGAYNFATIRVGNYEVRVSMPGFREFVRQNVVVSLNTVTRVDVMLQLGEITDLVTVTAETAVLQTDRAEVRAEIQEKALKELPVPIGRNYQNLFDTLPGFTTPTNAHSIPTNPSRALQFNVNGTSSSLNDIRIDGAGQYDIWLPHITVYIPSLEAIETVNVVTSSFDAEQGLAGGASINVRIKSGTNDYRGSAFWFNSNNALMARPFFLPATQRLPKYINNQYGGTLGGPIKKDKLFFFASFEGSPQREFASGQGRIPTLAMRGGDLSQSANPIYDPMTGNPDGTGRTAFEGNIIPADRIHPVSKKILDMMPAPTVAGPLVPNNYFTAGVFEFDRNVVDGKVDWQVNDKFNMYGRFSVLRYSMLAPTFFGDQMLGRPLAGGNSTHADGGTYGTTIAGTYVLTPNFVLDANFGYARKDTNSEMTRLDEKVGLDFLGIPGTNGPRQFEGSWPRIQVDGFEEVGITNNFMPYYRRDPQRQWAGNANWTRGRHNLRFGGELVKQHMNQTQPEFPGANHPAQGGFRFQGGVTALNGGPSPNEFNHFGAFLLGQPRFMGRILQVDDEYTTRMNFYSLYIRDRWQVTPKLSFSYGTRWEYFPMARRADRGMERYDFANNMMMVCGIGSVPEDCGVELSKRLFAPRLGLAYRATDKLVLRAGYGLTNDPFSLARPHRTNHPMLLALNLEGPSTFLPVAGRDLTTGIPLIPTPDLGNGIIDVPPQVAVNSVGHRLDRGYIQSWNLTIQRELIGGWVGELGYVATRQVRQLGYLDLNAGQVIGAGQAGRPYVAQFGRTARTAIFTGVGNSKYDAMQAQLNRRFAGGYQVDINYTWSKALGICGVTNSDNNACIQALDFYHLNRAPSSIHIPHRFNVSAIAESPFGRGKSWLTDGPGAMILGGWQLNTVLRTHSGFPFSITASGASLNLPGSTQRADQVKPDVEILGGIGTGQPWFDRTAFAPITEPRFGTLGFNTMHGPKQFNLDVGLFRKFQVTEGVEVQFRAEAFNFTNTPHFNNPNGDASSGNFGLITGTRNTGRENLDQRVFRFGLRVGF